MEATKCLKPSVFPDSTSPPKLNPVEPPWYGPVCPVVGEGWHREVSPYPNPCPIAVTAQSQSRGFGGVGSSHSFPALGCPRCARADLGDATGSRRVSRQRFRPPAGRNLAAWT